MTKFKILKSTNIEKDGQRFSRFEYELVEGKLLPGDVFRLYETHHYTNHSIVHLEEGFFYATPTLFIEGHYEGETLDTDNLLSGRKRGYSA